MLVQRGSFSIELLHALKADVATLSDSSVAAAPITPWDLRDANPDVIVMLNRSGFQDLRPSPAWADAVLAHGRPLYVASPAWSDPQGPSARRQVLADAAQWLYPWLANLTAQEL